MGKKHPGGRPKIVDKEVLQKLEEAFLMDCTDLEACFLANISKSTLYNYQEEHPEFLERKEALKQNLFIKARRTFLQQMENSYGNSMDYMSRKKKDEFAQRNELTGKEGKDLIPIAQADKELSEQTLDGYLNQGHSV